MTKIKIAGFPYGTVLRGVFLKQKFDYFHRLEFLISYNNSCFKSSKVEFEY